MPTLKHLPVDEWPEADCDAFRAAYKPGDVFDETAGPGAHLADGTREMIRLVYRRWLGFPEVSEQHYNLARSMQAGRRFAAHLANARNRLRPLATKPVPTARQSRDQNGSDRDSTKSILEQQNKTIQHRDRGEPSCA
jgi:hypothetical protein